MSSVVVCCDNCGLEFGRTKRRYNEAIKMGWLQFCSTECQSSSKKNEKIVFNCKRCGKEITRHKPHIEPSGNVFCSSHCSITYSNLHRVTKLSIEKRKRIEGKPVCANPGCLKRIGVDNYLYCSPGCRFEAIRIIDIDYVKKEIKRFVEGNGRIPIKYEVPALYTRARHTFGTWNKAVSASGFEPNPVRFAKKFTANDGHSCDSLSEKIVDDWLFARKIPHLTKIKYPWNNGMTTDFKVGDYWIELFGLCGQLKSYDNLMKEKLINIKKHKLKLIDLYLSDLFPINHLEEKLSILRK